MVWRKGSALGWGEERYKNIYTDKGKRASRNSKPTEVKEKPPCSNAEKEGGVLAAKLSAAHLKTQPDSKKNKKRSRPLTLVVQYKLHSCFRWSCCSDDWLQALIDIWLSALMGFPPRVSIRHGSWGSEQWSRVDEWSMGSGPRTYQFPRLFKLYWWDWIGFRRWKLEAFSATFLFSPVVDRSPVSLDSCGLVSFISVHDVCANVNKP